MPERPKPPFHNRPFVIQIKPLTCVLSPTVRTVLELGSEMLSSWTEGRSDMKTNLKSVAAMTILSAVAPALQAASLGSVNALWVYKVSSLPNAVTDGPTRNTLMQNSSASGVNMLYVAVYSSTPSSEGRHMYEDSDVSAFITAAHGQGMQVYAAMGDPDWPAYGCQDSSSPNNRFSDIVGYNSANPAATFDGIMLDVEPGSSPDFPSLLGLYQCFQQMTNSNNLGLAAAISAFWNSSVTFNSVTELVYQQIVDLGMNNVVVMGYRNTAGTLDCSQGDGIVCLDENIIQYANSVSQPNMILVGLNTDNPATSNAPANTTFYSLGQTAMNSAAQSVYSQFAAANESFGGFAIHNYRDSYLNGSLSGWPATNAVFGAPAPQFSASGVTNAASLQGDSIAPGEVITISGQNLGPGLPLGMQVVNGTVTTHLGGVRVLFNGTPGPVLFAYSNQVTAIVPFELEGPSVSIQVEYSGITSDPVSMSVAESAPGIFTVNGSGTGPIVAWNQDGSINSSANPAAPGSVVSMLVTGGGQTTPAGIDGLINMNPDSLAALALPMRALIGGKPATVASAGNTVGFVAGIVQVSLVVPSDLSAGAHMVRIYIGPGETQYDVTIAVQ